jgi:ABC-type multidrug transport system ATPase subunit
MMALMGPSGSGKTTLLNVLAQRATNASVQQSIYLNGSSTDLKIFRKLSSFVEQEDALVGSLTVRETLDFAARLALPRYVRPSLAYIVLCRADHHLTCSSVTKSERIARIKVLLSAFGLTGQSGTLIGTPIRKGVSGGQKRRVSHIRT